MSGIRLPPFGVVAADHRELVRPVCGVRAHPAPHRTAGLLPPQAGPPAGHLAKPARLLRPAGSRRRTDWRPEPCGRATGSCSPRPFVRHWTRPASSASLGGSPRTTTSQRPRDRGGQGRPDRGTVRDSQPQQQLSGGEDRPVARWSAGSAAAPGASVPGEIAAPARSHRRLIFDSARARTMVGVVAYCRTGLTSRCLAFRWFRRPRR
jgi:hypothetical protein